MSIALALSRCAGDPDPDAPPVDGRRCLPSPSPVSTTPRPIRDTRLDSTATRRTTRSRSTSSRAAARVVNLGPTPPTRAWALPCAIRRGRPAKLAWAADEAAACDSAGTRTVEYRLAATCLGVQAGWFVLGSMRVERDFQYCEAAPSAVHRASRSSWPRSRCWSPTSARLPAAERERQLRILRRRQPRDPPLAACSRRCVASASDSAVASTHHRPSLDGRNRLRLELRVIPRTTARGRESRRRLAPIALRLDRAVHRSGDHRRSPAHSSDPGRDLHSRLSRIPRRRCSRIRLATRGRAGSSAKFAGSSS